MRRNPAWEQTNGRVYHRLFSQIRKAGIYMRRVGSYDASQSWLIMDVPILKEKPGEYWYNPGFAWDFNYKAPLDIILHKKRNPSMDAEPALKILKQVAEENGLPAPLREIGSGSEGVVFSTSDPGQVCRVGTKDRVAELIEWQHSGAVVKVFYLEKMEAEDSDGKTQVWVSWQEMVDDNVEGYFYRKYKGDKDTQDRILGALVALYDLHWRRGVSKMKTLKEFKETEALAGAIEDGLPTNDLSLESNLGMTADGRVVAYDL